MPERSVIRDALSPPRDEEQRRRITEGVAERIRGVAQDGLPPEPALAAPTLRSGPFRNLGLMLGALLVVLLSTVGLLVSLHFAEVARAKTAAECNKPLAPQTTPSADTILKRSPAAPQ